MYRASLADREDLGVVGSWSRAVSSPQLLDIAQMGGNPASIAEITNLLGRASYEDRMSFMQLIYEARAEILAQQEKTGSFSHALNKKEKRDAEQEESDQNCLKLRFASSVTANVYELFMKGSLSNGMTIERAIRQLQIIHQEPEVAHIAVRLGLVPEARAAELIEASQQANLLMQRAQTGDTQAVDQLRTITEIHQNDLQNLETAEKINDQALKLQAQGMSEEASLARAMEIHGLTPDNATLSLPAPRPAR
jgi:hypothetical protein